jgi:DivIVA domain-containing protein
VVDDESSKEREKRSPPAADPGQEPGFGELRYYVPQEILDVSFPVSVRGYDRRAVDAYIKRVNRVIAELKVRGSPPAAVRHALEQAEDKVQGLLQAAREAADEITTSAQHEAEEGTARAKAEAAELTVNTSAEADRVSAEAAALVANSKTEADATLAMAKAEADEIVAAARTAAQDTLARAQAEAKERRQLLEEELSAMREEAQTQRGKIQADTKAVLKQRGELLEDMRQMAAGIVDLADAAAARIEDRQPVAAAEEATQHEARAESEPPGVATNASTRAMPAAQSHEDEDGAPRDEIAERTGSDQDM